MPHADPLLIDEAAAWLVRTRDPRFRDWEAFTAWLEADPARNDAYELLLDTDDAAGGLATVPRPAALPVVMPERVRRLGPRTGLAAAAMVATVAAVTLLPRHDRYTLTTRPGQHRLVTLADGTAIAMNGGTRLTLDRDAPRQARLDSGEAVFTVVHDAANPFAVESGGTMIEDIGTVFNVVRTADATEVAVAEGQVVYDPKGAAIHLPAGRSILDRDRGLTEVGNADPATVGLWRSGRLSYRAAPLGRVAADIARLIGEPVHVGPLLATRQFSGTIMVRGVQRPLLFSRLGTMAAVRATHDARGWSLTDPSVPR